MTETAADLEVVVEHYRNLVGALLDHTYIDYEGSEVAINDFYAANDSAAPILRLLIEAQGRERNMTDGH